MPSKQAAHRKDTRQAPATFTHQHFRKVAEIIRAMGKPYADRRVSDSGIALVAEHFARELADTNPNFDRHRFLMACQADT